MTGRVEQYRPTVEILARRWGSAGPLLAGFPLLAEGRPVGVEEIARAAGAGIAQINEAVDAARCERDGDGRLIDLYGLTLAPTRHRLEIGHKVLFSCCALWAQVIPKLVNATVRIESIDPVRQELVRLSISSAGIESVDPPAAGGTLVVTTQEAIERDVRGAWCRQVCFFVSRESAEEFAAGRPTCHAVELSEFQEVTDSFHRAIWRAVES